MANGGTSQHFSSQPLLTTIDVSHLARMAKKTRANRTPGNCALGKRRPTNRDGPRHMSTCA